MSSYSILQFNQNMDMSINYQSEYGFYLVDASNNNITIDLPSAPLDSYIWEFQRIDQSTNTVTFNAPIGYLINGNSSLDLEPSQYCQLIFTNGIFICARVNASF